MGKHAATGGNGKLVGAVALTGATVAIAGSGAFGSFTSTTSATSAVASGTVSVALGAAGTAANRLTVGAAGLVPGDVMQRAVELSNSGGDALGAVTLTTTAAPSSLLDTDTVGGLQLTVDRCSVPWTEGGTAQAYTYTCSGTASSVVAPRPVIGADVALPGLALGAGGAAYLRVTLALPATAGNALQGQSSALTFAFTGIQRAGTAK